VSTRGHSLLLLLLRWRRRRQTGRKRVLKLSTCKCVYRVSERICDIYSHLILIKAGGAPRFTFKYYHLSQRDIPSLRCVAKRGIHDARLAAHINQRGNKEVPGRRCALGIPKSFTPKLWARVWDSKRGGEMILCAFASQICPCLRASDWLNRRHVLHSVSDHFRSTCSCPFIKCTSSSWFFIADARLQG
jgi:hypothetical protein